MQVAGFVLPPNPKAYCGVPKVHSMAISMTEVCAQIFFLFVFFPLLFLDNDFVKLLTVQTQLGVT